MIGIFDSGIGGLSVWREIVRLMPDQSTLYFADQAHVPYGIRPAEEIQNFSRSISQFLIDRGARCIVVACNTASAAALEPLRQSFTDVPFIGMEPAIKPAAEITRTGVIGVLATARTLEGDLFNSTRARYAPHLKVISSPCDGLVDAIESGRINSAAGVELVKSIVQPMLDAGADTLTLACTHYPFAAPVIQKIAGNDVTLLDPSAAVAKQVQRKLPEDSTPEPDLRAQHRFYSSGSMIVFQQQFQLLCASNSVFSRDIPAVNFCSLR